MARNKGVIKLEGGLGALSFYTDRRYGAMVRRKGGPSKKQIKTLSSCAVVRRNNQDFGVASGAGKLLRTALYPVITACGDHSVGTRLQQVMLRVLRGGETAEAERRFFTGNFHLFRPLELNAGQAFDRYCRYSMALQKNRSLALQLRLHTEVVEKTGATHVRFVGVRTGVVFKKQQWVHEVQESLEVETGHMAAIELLFEKKLRGVGFYGVCLLFYQEVNGALHRLMQEELRCGVLAWEGAGGKQQDAPKCILG